ncbi:MAG: Rieske 2Fe-2S domain-containing protein [Candidatus Pacebacteria bacterium]|nr:Rieske 2Fe-2S domain-containing protein [Candidatus Paceibacterota bacterium]
MISAKAGQKFLLHNVQASISLLKGRFKKFPHLEVQSLSLGQAMIFELEGRKVGVFKDQQGKIHAVSTTCTHMGCTLNWNNAEESWDCPCHGSSFSCDGKLIHGPAAIDLEKIDVL